MASVMRAVSGEVVAMTSSSCMIMSEPMVFWREMECSGVRSLGRGKVRGKMGGRCFWGGSAGGRFREGMDGLRGAYIGVPSWGLRKRTPSSVTLASLRRETIWKLWNNLHVSFPKCTGRLI